MWEKDWVCHFNVVNEAAPELAKKWFLNVQWNVTKLCSSHIRWTGEQKRKNEMHIYSSEALARRSTSKKKEKNTVTLMQSLYFKFYTSRFQCFSSFTGWKPALTYLTSRQYFASVQRTINMRVYRGHGGRSFTAKIDLWPHAHMLKNSKYTQLQAFFPLFSPITANMVLCFMCQCMLIIWTHVNKANLTFL